MTKRWGATPEDWARFKKLAKADLLPVVSNPHAEISPRSKMKGKGKTPSIYNSQGQVAGFTDWTEHEATVKNIEAWAEEPDFGICVQTRRIRGLDIDVPDPELADAILCRFEQLVGRSLPVRGRADSGKRLAVFVCEAELSKRSFVVKEWIDEDTGKTKRWIVELLATGQQFIAVGTHPDGARYEWTGLGDQATTLDRLTLAELDEAWDALVAEFALEGKDRRAERRDATLLEDLDIADPVAEHLVETWTTYGYEKGMLYIECPWADGHSTDNGETQTAWLLAGTGKYRNGHFRCMHAGCAEHTDDAFFQVVGYKALKADEFEDLSADENSAALYKAIAPGASPKAKELKAEAKAVASPSRLPLPGFNRDNQGRIETSLENITRALTAPQAAECHIAHDEFRGELMIAERKGEWRSFTDADAVELRIRLEALGFKDRIGKEMMRDALELVGREHRFDSAREWLLNVVPEWDGVKRVERFFPDYITTEDTPYTQAVGLYVWSAHAGRILEPGVKADMVPVLVGPQGARKSSAIAAISPAEDFFAEFDLEAKDEDKARKMRGCLVGELAELRGLQTRDRESILAWITRRFEKWTPKFKEYETTLARRCVFWGSTNDDEFLSDPTGERRWLPVMALRLLMVDAIRRDRLQLWAEARDVFLAEGVLYEAAENLAKAEHDKFKVVDPWLPRVAAWLDDAGGVDDIETPRTSGCLLADDVLVECIGIPAAKITKKDQMRVGLVLRKCGMEKVLKRVTTSRNHLPHGGGYKPAKVWVDASGEGEL